MPRSRVLSFMSQWSSGMKLPNSSSDVPPSPTSPKQPRHGTFANITPSSSSHNVSRISTASPNPPRNRNETRTSSRPSSMIQTYQPPVMDVGDTIPELLPIFTYLNSHSNRLYQEGYFLKLNDLDARGRPSADRNWTECYAQLVGTVLSLWDAAQLDAAGLDTDVLPTFINLADASIKMIESLPMSTDNGQALHNVLSISTAASNRYLLHFNSLNSLSQWTAGIRLTMFEYASLQEAYTGGLIAGKGKTLNNIRQILDRTQFKYEDWVRVRFGAGTPWRRCWCVVSPPDQKESQKLQKTMKKRTIYARPTATIKGHIKFYESSKVTKKSVPIATVADAYSAYAIYPQSKSLIDQSTLIKLEGDVTVHAPSEATVEGFVFIMAESHPAVSGFEILLRTLIPVFDAFALYGRPTRLAADPVDTRSLMFAMPKDQKYGYLDVLDITTLLHADGSQSWSEREWRKQLKDLTAKRMNATSSQETSRIGRMQSRRNTTSRVSLPHVRTNGVAFEDEGPHVVIQPSTQPSSRRNSLSPNKRTPLTETANNSARFASPRGHQRSVSEAHGYSQYQNSPPSRLSYEYTRDESNRAPQPPEHGASFEKHSSASSDGYDTGQEDQTPEAESTAVNMQQYGDMPEVEAMRISSPPVAPVIPPPVFTHGPSQKPPGQPYQATELRRASSQVDKETLSEIQDASSQPMPVDYSAIATGDHGSHVPMSYNGGQEDINGYNQPSNDSLSRRRLSTIPASPYVDSSAFSPTTTGDPNHDAGPPVPTHGTMPRTHYFEQPVISEKDPEHADTPIPEADLRPRNSINRKPVPSQLNQTSSAGSQR